MAIGWFYGQLEDLVGSQNSTAGDQGASGTDIYRFSSDESIPIFPYLGEKRDEAYLAIRLGHVVR
jgi:hypothetical protein